MRRLALLTCFSITIWIAEAAVGTAAAQTRPPDQRIAVGTQVGVGIPRTDQLRSGPQLLATFEAYVMPRLAITFTVDGSWMGATTGKLIQSRSDLKRPVLTAGVFYKWNRPQWKPYAGAGIGFYRYSVSQSVTDPVLLRDFAALGLSADSVEVRYDRVGGEFVGGIEYSASSGWGVVGETRYAAVGRFNSIAGPINGSFFSPSVGFKRYF